MSIKRITSIILALSMVFMFAGCAAVQSGETESGGQQAARTDAPASEDPTIRHSYLNEAGRSLPIAVYASSGGAMQSYTYDTRYTASNNAFAVNMNGAVLLNAEDPDWSGVYSPLSLQIALQLLANGGDTRTADMLMDALCESMARQGVNESSARLMSILNSAEGVSLSNAIIANQDYRVSEDFARLAAEYYGAAVGAVDMNDAKAAEEQINKWISDHTNGLINDLVDGLSYDTVVLLVNTLCFEMEWDKPFIAYRELTDFYGTRGTQQVGMIQRNDDFLYGSFDKGSMALVPYKDENYRMAVILPADGVSPADAVSALIGRWNECGMKHGTVKMPKVDQETELEVMKMLESMGLDSFASVNYSGLIAGEGDMQLSRIYQGSKLHVDECGTVAASGTVAELTKGGFGPDEFTLTCDRPYAMVIYNVETGTVLFVSIVNNI